MGIKTGTLVQQSGARMDGANHDNSFEIAFRFIAYTMKGPSRWRERVSRLNLHPMLTD
jgi:hypothetical protein